MSPTTILALGLMATIVMMLLPVPAWILDVGLVTSFGLAALVFTIVLFIERPLDFSSFPTILLASLILRLSLNISSTKLIIGEGHTGPDAAGNVIEGVAMFVMGGDPFLGVVIFFILLIVNFVVITKGAARMAEVGARFALDGMPGRQLAIDADVSSGAISHSEAKERREREQAEATFFGSLDGVSKFVKGDAVAGLLITLLNLVVGLSIGVFVHGMAIGDALTTYAVLTVGDGLVTQLPAVIISVASALLLSRGGISNTTDTAIIEQVGRHPAAVATVAGLMMVFAVVPGFPFFPFLLAGSLLGLLAFLAERRLRASAAAQAAPAEPVAEPQAERSIGDLIDLDDIHIEFAPDLVNMVLDPGTGLETRIDGMRRHVASGYGMILPEVRLTDQPQLAPGHYRILIQGVPVAEERLRPNKVMALVGEAAPASLPEGEDVREPVYGAPARWVDRAEQDALTLAGTTVVSAAEVLATHLLEVVRANLSRLLSLKSLTRLLDELTRLSDKKRAEANRRLLDDLIPDKVPMDLVLVVLRLLLEERVSIRNLPLILETVAEARATLGRPEHICEYVRQRLGFQIVAEFRRGDGRVPLVQLAPEWEKRFLQYQVGTDGGTEVALPPEEFNRLAEKIAVTLREAMSGGGEPVLVTSARRRRFLKTVVVAKGLSTPVLSYEELGTQVQPAILGVVPP
ncbi:flagellar biosynthesis protein FlhA [Mangrovicoccus algicola]|uniref:Flagellar biosynthesis protein FlhA n=1 Tax=Mangrovicoccus algicola TaxID=2771008 RepID=A0A8J6YVZ0_9RHOB|nr:flagellar biosynthesis protein FlhA [Mangrovicoccus algicola]MBE3640218.1 flagellar biosynthesis protein FlhA [Mangrovicoccus algicola]